MVQKNKILILLFVFIGILLGAAMTIFNPFYILAAIIALAAIYLVFKKVEYGLLIVIFMLPFLGIFSGFTGYIKIVFFILAILLIKSLIEKQREFRDSLSLFIILFLILTIVSLFISNFFIGSYQLRINFTNWTYVIGYAAIYFIVVASIKNLKQIKRIIFVMLLSAITVSLIALLRYFKPSFFRDTLSFLINPTAIVRTRAFGTFSNPNYLGVFLVLCIPIAIGMLIYNKKTIKKTGAFIATILMAATLFYTYSRNAYLSFVVGLFGFGFLGKQKKILAVTVLILLIGAISFPMIMHARLEKTHGEVSEQALAAQRQEDFSRTDVTLASLKIISKYPVFGTGYGTFQILSPDYTKQGIRLNTHNEFLRIGAEMGLITLLVFLIFFAYIFKNKKDLLNSKNDFIKGLTVSILAAILAFFVANIFINPLEIGQIMGYFWLMLGLLTVLKHVKTENVY